MEKSLIYLVLLAALLWIVADGVKFCRVSSDCVYGKRCCERVCLHRKACDGLCSSDLDCDKSYGESCDQGRCTCERPPCTIKTQNKAQCMYDSECDKNQTCKDDVCQSLDSITKPESMNPVVLGVVATVGLIIFVGAFYLCLRKQRSSRPSLAAKQVKLHHHQAIELEGMNDQLDTKDEIENSKSKERHDNVKKHSNITKDLHKRPQGARGSSLNELSVVLEEDPDEVSDVP